MHKSVGGHYAKKMIVPETAKIFPAGQTVKAKTSACGDLDGKPRRLIEVAISETINLSIMLLKSLRSPRERPDT